MSETIARLATLSPEERAAVLASMPPEALEAIQYSWPLWARPDQMAPSGDWRTWLLLGGRGSGKTRSSAEWVRGEIEAGRRRQLGIVGPTADALRRIQIEGPSGLLSVCPPWNRPTYEPSTRKVSWPNGAVCHLFSAEEPDRLRGPNLDGAWADELTSWPTAAGTWDMLQMCLRVPGPLGHAPQAVVSTTPKLLPLLKAILAAPSTVTTRARTSDNAANLDASTLEYLHNKYGGTTLGRQELDAELLEDLAGALWTRAMLDACRVGAAGFAIQNTDTGGPAPYAPEPSGLRRIVVAVDPAGGSGRRNAETGIIAAGRAADGHSYVLRDASGRYSPEGWARRAVELFDSLKADRIVCEANFGGAMVEGTIRAVAPNVPVQMVNASRGKQVRAEPIVALYEQRRVHHVGQFPELEDQMCGWDPTAGGPSPDRVDALVWAITDLARAPGGVRVVSIY